MNKKTAALENWRNIWEQQRIAVFGPGGECPVCQRKLPDGARVYHAECKTAYEQMQRTGQR